MLSRGFFQSNLLAINSICFWVEIGANKTRSPIDRFIQIPLELDAKVSERKGCVGDERIGEIGCDRTPRIFNLENNGHMRLVTEFMMSTIPFNIPFNDLQIGLELQSAGLLGGVKLPLLYSESAPNKENSYSTNNKLKESKNNEKVSGSPHAFLGCLLYTSPSPRDRG